MPLVIKKTRRKKPVSKKSVSLTTKEIIATPEKQFINIYERDQLVAAKTKLSWLIVGLLVLALVIFWFWSMKATIKKNSADNNLNEITAEITGIVKEFRGLVNNTKNAINQTNDEIATQESLEEIKNKVLTQIQINSESANWPQHSSELLGLALKYPTNWFKQEKRDSLALVSYHLSATSTPEVFATVTITKITDKKKDIKIIDLLEKPENYQKSAEEILKSDADRLIVDLRNNPGGLLDSAINLSGWFLNRNKTVTIEEFADGTRNQFTSDGNGALKIYPTVLLINGGSASASEILAGALHDNLGIKLVGEKSFGKGSVQELEKFSDGSSLKVTIAKWLTPSGISISEKGIEPDVKVEIPSKDMEENKIEIGIPDKDPQLDKAIDMLK